MLIAKLLAPLVSEGINVIVNDAIRTSAKPVVFSVFSSLSFFLSFFQQTDTKYALNLWFVEHISIVAYVCA